MSTETDPARRPGAGTCPYAGRAPFSAADVGPAFTPGWLATSRENAPIFWMPEADMWVVTRYEDMRRIAVDHRSFSSRSMNPFKPMAGRLAEAFPDGHPGEHSILKMDAPDHSRVRRLADVAFSRHAADGYTDDIRSLVGNLIDEFADDGRVDFVQRFSSLLPLQVILHVSGIPLELEEEFSRWGADYFALQSTAPNLTAEQEEGIARRAERVLPWMRDYLERRRRNPGTDLVSHLLKATTEQGDPRLTDYEIMGVINSNLVAGVETTVAMLPEMFDSLLSDRSRWEALLADRSLVPAAVEEALRWWCPARGARRRALVDSEICGVVVRAGEEIWLPWISGNQDDEIFPDAAEFDLHRTGLAHHLAFGKGVHLCIGAQVARKELIVSLEEFLDRMPSLRMTGRTLASDVPVLFRFPRHTSLTMAWDADGPARGAR